MALEICLIVIGIVVLIISFVLSAKEKKSEDINVKNFDIADLAGDRINELVDKEVDSTIDEKVESFEIQLDKLSNEKIMSMGEYSETIMEEIKKNHNEVLFLYNMLKDKENEVKLLMSEVENLKKSVKNLEAEKKAEEKNNIFAGNTDKTEFPSEIKPEVVANPEAKENFNESNIVVETKISTETLNIQADVEKPVDEQETKKSVEQEEIPRGSSKKDPSGNKKRILDLYNQGKTNVQIAKELGLGVGEVRLVVDLYKNKN